MDTLGEIVKRTLKQASIIAVVLNYAALHGQEQVRVFAPLEVCCLTIRLLSQAMINTMIEDVTKELHQEIYVFVNKFDQRNTASGGVSQFALRKLHLRRELADMDEAQVKQYVRENMTFGCDNRALNADNIFPVSAKYAQYANTARSYLEEDGDDPEVGCFAERMCLVVG